jgi:hypothetical protein
MHRGNLIATGRFWPATGVHVSIDMVHEDLMTFSMLAAACLAFAGFVRQR